MQQQSHAEPHLNHRYAQRAHLQQHEHATTQKQQILGAEQCGTLISHTLSLLFASGRIGPATIPWLRMRIETPMEIAYKPLFRIFLLFSICLSFL
jgi:hypothetical protein